MRLGLALVVLAACGGGDRAAAPAVTAPPVVAHDAAVAAQPEPPPVPSYEVARSGESGFRTVATSATHVAWASWDRVWWRPHGVDGAVQSLGVIEGVGGVVSLHVGTTHVYATTTDARVVALRAGAEPAVLPLVVVMVVGIDGDDALIDDRGAIERYRGDQHVETLTAWTAPVRPTLDGFDHQGVAFDDVGGVVLLGPWRFELDGTTPVRASFDDIVVDELTTHALALTATHVYIAAPLAGAPDVDVLRALPRRGAYRVTALDPLLGGYQDLFTDGARVYGVFESRRVGLVEDTAYRFDARGAHAVHTAARLEADADGDDFAFDEDGDVVAAYAGRRWSPAVEALASRAIHGGDTTEIAVPDGMPSFHGNVTHSWIAFVGDRAFVVDDEAIVAFDTADKTSRVVWRHPQLARHAHRSLTGDIVAIDGALYVTDGRRVTRVSPDGKTASVLEAAGKADLARLDAADGRLFALDHEPTPSQLVEVPLDGSARRPVFPMPDGYIYGRYALTSTDIHLYVPGIHAIVVVPLP